ncbi:MAG: YkvA family protein [bacterium]
MLWEVTTDNRKPEGFEHAQKTAENFAQDKEKTGHLLNEAIKKAQRNQTLLKSIWEDLQALFRLLKAWRRGQYPDIPWQTIVFAIAGVVYFVNPFDIIPDFIPGSGYLDDATVIGFIIKSIQNDIKQFTQWEKTQT